MAKPSEQNKEARLRIDEARQQLRKRRFHCLARSPLDLRSYLGNYSAVEAWANGSILVYLVYNTKTGCWDLLSSLGGPTNSIGKTWENLDSLTPFSARHPEMVKAKGTETFRVEGAGGRNMHEC